MNHENVSLDLAYDMAVEHFPLGSSLLDLACATAPISRRLWAEGRLSELTLADVDLGFLRRAKAECPGARAIWVDLERAKHLPYPAHCALFTNASGFFSPGNLLGILARIRTSRLLANFLVLEDQASDFTGEFDMGGGEMLHLTAISEKDLEAVLARAGWGVTHMVRYLDFKRERMMLLERKQ